MRPEDLPENAPGYLVLVERPRSERELREEAIGRTDRPTHVHAYVPHPLPPSLAYTDWIVSQLARAMRALGRLDRVVQDLPDSKILVRPFAYREAIESTRIEGTIASIDDIVVYEEAGTPENRNPRDVREADNYVRAFEFGLERLDDRPVSLSMIRELHQLLLDGTRGDQFKLGQERDGVVYIGNPDDLIEDARYVPPPPAELSKLLFDLVDYIAEPSDVAPLIRIALVHYQFETIHPYFDGNGRLGRLLISLLLKQWEVMIYPVVDLSAYLLVHRDTYIEQLGAVSRNGSWLDWVEFFLEAVATQAEDALRRSERLKELRESYLQQFAGLSRSLRTSDLVDHLFINLTVKIKGVSEILGVSPHTAESVVNKLVEAKVLEEATGRKRDRIYRARQIIAVLDDRPF